MLRLSRHIQLFHMCLCHKALFYSLPSLNSCLVVIGRMSTLWLSSFRLHNCVSDYICCRNQLLARSVWFLWHFNANYSPVLCACLALTVVALCCPFRFLDVRASADINVNNLFISYSTRTHCFRLLRLWLLLFFVVVATMSWVIIVHVARQQRWHSAAALRSSYVLLVCPSIQPSSRRRSPVHPPSECPVYILWLVQLKARTAHWFSERRMRMWLVTKRSRFVVMSTSRPQLCYLPASFTTLRRRWSASPPRTSLPRSDTCSSRTIIVYLWQT